MPTKKLFDFIANPNIANDLNDEELRKISAKVIEGYNEDLNSRAEWQINADKILDLAGLKSQKKNKPWPNCSNVKYPVIASAILQYAARTYPEVVRDGKVVQCAVIGKDPDGMKAERAIRVGDFMSYQLLIESPTWEDSLDRLIHSYSAVGVGWKKTYYDPIYQRNESVFCLHDEIVINDNITSLATAPRVTHIVRMSTNDILSMMRSGLYKDCPVEEFKHVLGPNEDFHDILEQHRFLDLDEDDYEEPYIVTVHKKTEKVLRIIARYDPTGTVYNSKDEVSYIKPVEYFTDFHCIPRTDGKYHSNGLGTILLHPNEVINTLINELVDSGVLANTQGGLIGSDVEIIGGMRTISPGEWLKARAMPGSLLKDQVVPITYKEPSDVIFKMLEVMIESSKDLSSVTNVVTGNEKAQNAPLGTVQILDDNSKKIFTSLQRRFYRGLKSEFAKLYRLNRIYLPEQVYYQVMDTEQAILRADFDDESMDVKPVSDPNLSSETQRLTKAQTLLQMTMNIPGANVKEAYMRALEAMDTPNKAAMWMPEGSQPPPIEQIQTQMDMKKHQDEMSLKDRELQLKEREFMAKAPKMDADASKSKAQAIKLSTDSAINEDKHRLDAGKHELEGHKVQQAETKQSQDHLRDMSKIMVDAEKIKHERKQSDGDAKD